jgi:sugar O-acyltransferase (sialic acid O-acetyltransferase NeuD family)
MKPVVIFGAGEFAEVADFYLTHDGGRKVEAFTVNADRLAENRFRDKTVVPFEEILNYYPPNQYDMLVAIGYTRLNQARADKCAEAKAKGYKLISYVCSKSVVWPDLSIGENCFILENMTIQPFVKIGNNVTLWSGNHIGHHSQIGDNCFLTSHVVVSGGVQIGKNCFLGVNATIRDHIKIADYCVIGANTLILKDTQEKGVYIGNPAELSKVPSDRLKKL